MIVIVRIKYLRMANIIMTFTKQVLTVRICELEKNK